MRIVSIVCCTAALAITLSLAGASTGATAKHMKKHPAKASASASIAKGKALIAAKRCNMCHGANLAGFPGRSPSLHPGMPMNHYNKALFERLMSKGLDEEGKKVGPPMDKVCTLTAAQGDALYAYLKTLK